MAKSQMESQQGYNGVTPWLFPSFQAFQKAREVHGMQSVRVAVDFLQFLQQVPGFHFCSKQNKGEKHRRLYVILQTTRTLKWNLELKSQVKAPLRPTKAFRIKAELSKKPQVNRTI